MSDTVAGFLAAGLCPGLEGETIQLGTGRSESIGEVFRAACAVCGVTATVEEDPARVRPPQSEVMVLQSDPARARTRLGGQGVARGRARAHGAVGARQPGALPAGCLRRLTGTMTGDRLAAQVIEAARAAVADPDGPQPLHEPVFEGREVAYLTECIETGWVSSVGTFVDRFERELAAFTGSARAVAVANGTVALHACLRLAGVQPGDEVLVPALTFVGTVNPIAYAGAIPHFVDSEEATLGVDPDKLADYLERVLDPSGGPRNRQTGRPVRALVVMHTYGHPARLHPLAQVAERFGLVLIEDAAESLGSWYRGTHTGNVGRLAAMSFNGNKTVTTGGGGAILTNDEALGALAKHVTTTAKQPHRWAFNHDMVAYNYRMPNINAALGCAQLEQLAGFLEAKRALAGRYVEAFQGVDGVRIFTEPPECRSNYWLNVLLLDPVHESRRDAVLEATNAAGITTRPAWTLMHRLPMFSAAPRMDLCAAESLERRLLNLPSGVGTARGRKRSGATPAG
jgi:perosamine synthetase